MLLNICIYLMLSYFIYNLIKKQFTHNIYELSVIMIFFYLLIITMLIPYIIFEYCFKLIVFFFKE